jgi:hypothetical protein
MATVLRPRQATSTDDPRGVNLLNRPILKKGTAFTQDERSRPTQCEALTLVAVQVFGNDHAVAFAGSQGSFQLNLYKPVILHNLLESIQFFPEAARSFHDRCARGIEPNEKRVREHLDNSLMLVTALNPHIGYEKAAQISLKVYRADLALREAALSLGHLPAEQFDEWVRPENMTRPLTPRIRTDRASTSACLTGTETESSRGMQQLRSRPHSPHPRERIGHDCHSCRTGQPRPGQRPGRQALGGADAAVPGAFQQRRRPDPPGDVPPAYAGDCLDLPRRLLPGRPVHATLR